MKKSTKVMLIIACSLGVVGIGLTAGGAAMGASMEGMGIFEELKDGAWELLQVGDWEMDEEDVMVMMDAEEGDGKTKTYDLDAVSEMEIDLRYDQLILRTHAESGIKVEVINDSGENVRVKTEGNTLEIEGSKKVQDRVVKVYYPENYQFRKVEIEVDAGQVILENEIYAGELDVKIGAGEFMNDDRVEAVQADVEVGAGTVEISRFAVKQLDAECGLGSMILSLAGTESDYNYKLECGVGELVIGDDSYSGLSNKKDINNAGASGSITLECGMGNIYIDFEG